MFQEKLCLVLTSSGFIYIIHFIILYEPLTKPLFDPGLLSILIIQIVKTQKIPGSFKILKSFRTL
jgi:hypothetical protein